MIKEEILLYILSLKTKLFQNLIFIKKIYKYKKATKFYNRG